MMGNFFAFVESVADHTLFWVGAFLMIGPYFEGAAPHWWQIASNYIVERPERRKILFRTVGFAAILFSCFQAWNTQYEAAGQNQNHLAMKALLSTAIDEGEALNKDWFKRTDANAYLHEANIWSNKTGHLIEDAYGKGEADVFASDAGIISYVDPQKPATKTHSEIINRLQRLNELMPRVDTLPMQPNFDPNKYHWVTECADC
jgi:hypothetical protein